MSEKNDIEKIIIGKIIDEEFETSIKNREVLGDDYQSYVDLLDNERDDKEYDWMSDIRIPEAASQFLTQSSIDVDQYFRTRDFVEVFLEDDSDEALVKADATKELLNRTLNQRHLRHYLKFVRSKLINHLAGSVVGICWWEKKFEKRLVGQRAKTKAVGVGPDGEPIESIDEIEDVYKTVAVIDRFNYDVIEVKDYFESSEYTYNVNDKKWVAYRIYRSLDELKKTKDRFGYFNLGKLKDLSTSDQVNSENENSGRNLKVAESDPVNPTFEIFKRFGNFWVVVDERDENTNLPTKISYGLDVDGVEKENAELLEVMITIAKDSSGNKVLIGFDLNPFVDAFKNNYRPIIKGLCYVHPSEDVGLGDGKYSRELQTAIDDTFNMGNDRVRLATMPTFIGNKYTMADNDSLYFEPEHLIEVEDIQSDLRELKIDDNIVGSMQQLNLLFSKSNQVMSIFPTTMGSLPQAASTTATAVAGAENRTSMRTNYKSLTYEYTFLSELYWIIQQMTWQFAEPETGVSLMGDKVFDFDPSKEYWYKPLSQSIENEYSKESKIRMWTQVLGYVANIGHPEITKVINYILTQLFKYMGDEFVNFGRILLDESVQVTQGGEQVGDVGGGGATNQSGIQQSMIEIGAREAANVS